MIDTAYERPCYRALDTPLKILGLEISDWLLLVVTFVASLFGAVLLGVTLLLAVPFCLWAVLLKTRKGRRRPSYLRYLAYRTGLVFVVRWIFPELVPGSFLIAPTWLAGKSLVFFPVRTTPCDAQGPAMKFFLGGERWIDRDAKLARLVAASMSDEGGNDVARSR
jgi:hypothetical protein